MKELNSNVMILYNTSSADDILTGEYSAEYYGVNTHIATKEMIEIIHERGAEAYVWTVNTPKELIAVKAAGADGIVTNYAGLMKVVRYQAYSFIAENYVGSFTMPGLYGPNLPKECDDMAPQGLTLTDDGRLVLSAYSESDQNSILYIMDLSGNLQGIVDTGMKAHIGAIAYDSRGLLWITGEEGLVYAVSWTTALDGNWQGEAFISFDAGLLNHNEVSASSFLSVDGDRLYVGSYVDGAVGSLKCYDILDACNPRLVSEMVIPERIRGVTFQTEETTGKTYMFLSQGYQMEDSWLLKYEYSDGTTVYAEPLERHTVPEGVRQIVAAPNGFYMLFESTVRSHREISRIRNDQIYILHV